MYYSRRIFLAIVVGRNFSLLRLLSLLKFFMSVCRRRGEHIQAKHSTAKHCRFGRQANHPGS